MSKKQNESIFFGVLIIILGILFLLRNLGITNLNLFEILIKYWPMILIYVGGRNIFLYFTHKK